MNVNETKVMNILNQLSELTLDEQRVVNKGLVQMIRQTYRVKAVTASAKLSPGQVVKFHKSGRGRNAGLHYVRVEGFNRAGTAVVGHECNSRGEKLQFAPRWTVSTTSCSVVEVA